MTTFKLHDEQSAPAASRGLLEDSRKKFGFVPNLYGHMAESPALLRSYFDLSELFAASNLSPVQQQVVLLTVSRFHGCRYCVAAHSLAADMMQVPAEITDAIRDGRSIPDAKLQTLRVFTEVLLEQRAWLSTKQQEALLAAGYSRQQLLDVLVGVALKTLSNYTNHLTETELDEAFGARAWQSEAVAAEV